MSGLGKRLLKNEVPKGLHGFIDFEIQEPDEKSHTRVPVTCPGCGRRKLVSIYRIRDGCQKGTWTANCTSCCPRTGGEKTRKYLVPDDVPQEALDFIDFDSQQIHRRAGYLMISIKCPYCGESRRKSVSALKDHFRRKSCVPSCQRCVYQGGRKGSNWRGGIMDAGQGRVYKHIDTWQPEARYILEPMLTERQKANGSLHLLEHRAIVALALGRSLTSDEHVHHINGDPADNRLENLQLVDHHKRPICPCCGWRMDEWPKGKGATDANPVHEQATPRDDQFPSHCR